MLCYFLKNVFTNERNQENMNRQECDILKLIAEEGVAAQRELSEKSGHSLGIVNRCVKVLEEMEYIDENMQITRKGYRYLETKIPHSAIILAAGFGMRMVPINVETSKGLLEVKGEILIERIIKQLHKAEIYAIYIVVGFMKEKYEYLIDKYQVDLIVNSEYAIKNNMHSLKKAIQYLSNTYIIPCDIWCYKNPFSKYELYSWYMVSDEKNKKSPVRVNRKKEITLTDGKAIGNTMIGISYLQESEATIMRQKIADLCQTHTFDDAFWETALFQCKHISMQARIIKSTDVVEINTYEQLREMDSNSNHLKTEAIKVILDIFKVNLKEVGNIALLKKGMTNRSFLFECKGKKYIMRIPGEGTDNLINRVNEAEVYQKLAGKDICDKSIYFNANTGYKITVYLNNSRVCNPSDWKDVEKCMEKLRTFHNMKIAVEHEFDLFNQINFYEQLWGQFDSVYEDYAETKKKVFSLKKYVDSFATDKVLTHIDAVPDNFLFVKDEKGKEKVFLIDWEYAGMQDPHIDIAMFSIYAFYDKVQIDKLISIYFENQYSKEIKIKIYCYVAICGLLWSNWCEYKRNLGIDFGEYSLRQYRYAKDFYRIVCNELREETEKWGIK